MGKMRVHARYTRERVGHDDTHVWQRPLTLARALRRLLGLGLLLAGCSAAESPSDAGIDATRDMYDGGVPTDGAANTDGVGTADAGDPCVPGVAACTPSDTRCEGERVARCECDPVRMCCFLVDEACAGDGVCRTGDSGGPLCTARDAVRCTAALCVGDVPYRCTDGWSSPDPTARCEADQRCVLGVVSGAAICVADAAVACDAATFGRRCAADGSGIVDCSDGFTREMRRCSASQVCVTGPDCVDAIAGVPVPCDAATLVHCPSPTTIAVCTAGGYRQTRPCAVPALPETALFVCVDAGPSSGYLCLPPDAVLCDPRTFVDSCDGTMARFCDRPFGADQEVLLGCDAFGPDHVCRLSASGAAVCALADAALCTPVDETGRCVPGNRVERCTVLPHRYPTSAGFTSVEQCGASAVCTETCVGGPCVSPSDFRLSARCQVAPP